MILASCPADEEDSRSLQSLRRIGSDQLRVQMFESSATVSERLSHCCL